MTDVAIMPIKRPTKGFVVVAINAWEKSFPNSFKEVPIRSRLKTKRYRNTSNLRVANRLGYVSKNSLILFIYQSIIPIRLRIKFNKSYEDLMLTNC